MARILITGSSDGIGLRTAQQLVAEGHRVVLHARNSQRAREAQAACPGAETVLVGDLSSIAEMRQVAAAAAALVESGQRGEGGSDGFDCVIHNAGVYRGQDNAIAAGSGYPRLFTINVLAPYVLAALMAATAAAPRRLVFVASGLHAGGQPRLETMPRGVTYRDSKLQCVMLAKAWARRAGGGRGGLEAAMAVDPGWVPTKLGGRSAPDRMEDAVATYCMAALGTGAAAGAAAGGQYFARSRAVAALAVADDEALQEALLAKLASLSGVPMPE